MDRLWIQVSPMRFLLVLFNILSFALIGDRVNAAPTLAPSDSHEAREIVVNIKTRAFKPDTLALQIGEKIRLVLRNQDVELHAFVPMTLFHDSALNVSGNGAPEFGPKGLRRVLLPSQGQTEILFIPQRPGTYPFYCDLPGHEMAGTVVVQE